MKRPAIRSNSQQSVGMTSMIDVVFLLLVFFVWTSSFDAPEQDMPGGLAVAAESTSVSSETLPPEETTDSVISLRERLDAIAELGISPPVIVDPDGDVSMAATVATVDMVRLSGFDRVHLAVSADSSAQSVDDSAEPVTP